MIQCKNRVGLRGDELVVQCLALCNSGADRILGAAMTPVSVMIIQGRPNNILKIPYSNSLTSDIGGLEHKIVVITVS